MGKLYVFAIGGTGSRVLRSLTMLLASGCKTESSEIVPIIIDPDASAADMTRTVELLKCYSRIHKKLNYTNAESNRFFETELTESLPNYRLPIKNTSDKKYHEFINFSSMSRENQALVSMLFSEANLDSDMNVGFKGNPNVGSVVLNQFATSTEYQNFEGNFQQGDRIFIISSIFGGTGASGFPLLLKTFREASGANQGLISNATIGAITVLPYFGLQQDKNSAIDSTSFISKARSALSYYSRNIIDNNSIDYLYYIADNVQNVYENCEGGQGQRNDAHIVEMLAALSILDFDKNADPQNRPNYPQTKEFGLKQESNQINFGDFAQGSKNMLAAPLTQMMLFSRFCNEKLDGEIDQQPWSKVNGLDKTFFSSDFSNDVRLFLSEYEHWVCEMQANKRSFAPFEMKASDPISGVRGYVPSYGFFNKKGFNRINDELNNQTKSKNTEKTSSQKFMDIFYKATKEIVSKTLKM